MFKPLNGRVLIKPAPQEEQATSSGILVARKGMLLDKDGHFIDEKPSTGEVIVGGKLVKKGDQVVFSKFGYDEVLLNAETHYVVSEVNILGIF